MIKKQIIILVLLLILFGFISCGETTSSTVITTETTSEVMSTTTETATTETATTTLTTEYAYVYSPIDVPDYVLEEEKLSFKFFWEVVNGDPTSDGFGMIADRYNTVTKEYYAASIASVGYALAGLPAGVENNWISFNEGYNRALGTLRTIQSMDDIHGFFYHFISMDDTSRAGTTEISIIDTAIMICGAIVSAEYFGGEVKTLAYEIYQAVEWDWYYNSTAKMFYMGYSPEQGHFGGWDGYAEQLMLYFLAAASDDYSVGIEAYNMMKIRSERKQYGTSDYFYVSYPGTLFTYQYSHAFFDFRNALDSDDVDWFENSIQASIAAYDFAIFQSQNYKTYSETAWGNTACDGPDGYKPYGNLPAIGTIQLDGTLAPGGAIGSIVFVPELVLPAMAYYNSLDSLQSKYGLLDAFNLGVTETAGDSIIRPIRTIPINGWFDTDVIGIDKGITLLMIENYRSGLIWDYFMRSEIILKGYEELGFTILDQN
ncbi:MAG: hypothetical protein JEZ05_08700 [Tenericutes bacterium]|nr:hypothetical protein [Mycoplasmatota bacterium]